MNWYQKIAAKIAAGQPYGYWLLPDGNLSDVYGEMGHENEAQKMGFSNDEDAKTQGYIAIRTMGGNQLSVSLANPASTQQIRVIRDLINDMGLSQNSILRQVFIGAPWHNGFGAVQNVQELYTILQGQVPGQEEQFDEFTNEVTV